MEDDRTAEFVVVETVSQLRSAYEQVQFEVSQLRNQVAALRSKTAQMELTVEAVENNWRLASSAILMVAPLMIAYILDYKSRELYMTEMTALAPLITAMVCVSVCIGVPVFAAAFLEHTTFLAMSGDEEADEKADKKKDENVENSQDTESETEEEGSKEEAAQPEKTEEEEDKTLEKKKED